jgi:hypothetical protein
MANPFAQFSQPSASPGGGNPFSRFAPLAQPKTFERDEDEALYREVLAKETERRSKPRVPMSGVQEPVTAEEAAIQAVQQQRGREGEQKEFDASRTPVKRVLDASTFALSAPIRMATRGEYGLGDVAGLVSDDAKRVYNQSEADFARANETGLGVVKAIGDVSAGIPALSTMGAPLRGLAATGTALASRPLPASAVPRALVRNKRLEQIQDFEGAGVKVFAPALEESGVAGTVKQLSDAPVVGAPVRKALTEAVEQTRDAGERIAGEYGGAKTYRDVGNVVEKGLERFRDAKAADLGEEAARGLSDEALAANAARPARETSIKTKQDALYERAWRGIPEEMQKGKSKKDATRYLGGMTKTKELLDDLSGRNQRMYAATRGNEPVDPRLSYPVRGGVAGQIVEDIIDGRWRGNLQSMRDVRSNFRRLASGMPDTERNTLQVSDHRRMQSAMTQDMIGLLERNVKHYENAGNPAQATKVRRAIHDFRRADQFTRASVGRLEAIEKLYGAQSAESLAIGIVKDAMGGRKGGNFARLSALRRSLKDDEWGDVSSGVIRELGRPVASARGIAEDAGFSVQSFMTRWREMSEEGKNVLFNRTGEGGKPLRVALDRFVRVADKMANFEAMANTSHSATNALGMAGLASVFTAAQQAITGNLQAAAAAGSVAAGTYAFGRFMTSPLYVRWLTRAAELSGDPGKLRLLRAEARKLARLAEKEPDPAVQSLMGAVAAKIGDATREEFQER